MADSLWRRLGVSVAAWLAYVDRSQSVARRGRSFERGWSDRSKNNSEPEKVE
jgi:hypothetical protein